MAELLFGAETEYAVTGGRRSRSQPEGGAAEALLRLARRRLVNLPDTNSHDGLYLSNGARFYVDCGTHPEYSTPECTNPWDVVRNIEAGHRILADLARGEKESKPRLREILCFRSNVDYSGSGATWGSHESYLTKNAPAHLKAQVLPHLVTRPIYTGAGGFNPLAKALEFSLSPRLAYFQYKETDDSTRDKGIWNGRQEPLCKGNYRLHVTCGESLCSQTATFLKFGTTALIVAMADAGFNPADGIEMACPVAALHRVITDPTCRAHVTASETALSAIDVQRHYLSMAESHLHDEFMPPWAYEVCRQWRDILDRLEAGPEAVVRTLDWAIKLALFTNQLKDMGDEKVSRRDRKQGPALELLPPIQDDAGPAQAMRRSHRVISGCHIVISEGREAGRGLFDAPTEPCEFSEGEIDSLKRRRDRMFEIDMRFGQVGGAGIFDALDREGVLDHRIVEEAEIVRAMTHAPERSRARLRGEVVRRLAGSAGAQCGWQRIVDAKEKRLLDLSNPFENQEMWRVIDPQDTDETLFQQAPSEWSQHPLNRRQRAYEMYIGTNYFAAEQLLRELIAVDFETASNRCHLARALMLMDRELEAREEIALAWAARADASPYAVPRILFFRCVFAVLDGESFGEPLAAIKEALRGGNAHESWTIGPMLEYLRPRLGEEIFVFLEALAAGLSESTNLDRLDEFSQWRSPRSPTAAPS
jgi:hypothetical protein